MRKSAKFIVVAGALGRPRRPAPLAMAANPGGGTTTCRSDNMTAPVENNLVVPAGATCSLWGAQDDQGQRDRRAGSHAQVRTSRRPSRERDCQRWQVPRFVNRPVTIKKNLTITNSPGASLNGFWNVYDDRPSRVLGNFNYAGNAAPLYVGYLGLDVAGSFTYA